MFACRECGDTFTKWSGRCPSCGAWDSMVEMAEADVRAVSGETKGVARPQSLSHPAQPLKDIPLNDVEERLRTGMGELDRVLGGGIVPGSLVLIGGDPGIGKSTLLLQMAALLSSGDVPVLYATGEESLSQLKMRARRLKVPGASLHAAAETALENALSQATQLKAKALIIDSIQTMYRSDLSGSPGSPSQLRECTLSLMSYAKSSGCAVFLVGHVTKEGVLAGPRMLEHMVDTVIYFEGDRHLSYRVLRAVKNRFGATHEIGVFEMGAEGLIPVDNPSLAFVQGHGERDPGSMISCVWEGTRPILIEAQALVSRTHFASPQRISMGFDSKRLSVLLALLEKFAGVEIGMQDVFVNMAGGIRVEEPAVDLAVAAAVSGNHLGRRSVPATLAIGELGLNGELRRVPQLEARLREAARLGFHAAVIPEADAAKLRIKGMELHPVKKLSEALPLLYQS
jgi:DNA repair protein RadA/Sms